MPLPELARADARAILSLDGDSATLTAPAALGASVYVVPCLFQRVGVKQDAEGGFAVIGESTTLSVSLDELADAGLADPELLKTPGWTAAIGGKTYKLAEAPVDYTCGLVTLTLKRTA